MSLPKNICMASPFTYLLTSRTLHVLLGHNTCMEKDLIYLRYRSDDTFSDFDDDFIELDCGSIDVSYISN